ncbi:hypothetical protein GA0074696_0131 [Micromonospora purpureochromogenes]|uniref:LPXTG-motif cell wall anchor domain-containing protein n=1 Tax=Micromonospora purpureochromogenes TaxID=47872 RepID=A0A1C4U5D3_9ACTN|nr:hypothetical protein [Micromonospora purpureochromogenes]SCE66953.1 hypothetical protein GA0074696_0131 [Micromonospora purpureochromogenes]
MIFRHRPLARLSAAALLAAGAFTALGTPAHAEGAGTDLSLDVVGTRVAANVEGKAAFIKISNNGTNEASSAKVNVDVTELDSSKAEAIPLGDECEEITLDGRRIWQCTLYDYSLPTPGRTAEVPLLVFKDNVEGAYSAPVTFTLVSPDDTTPDNNTKTLQVEFTEESGVDLGARVPDVTKHIGPDEYDPDTEGLPPLRPGDTTVLVGDIFNQGDLATDGLRVTLELPTGVTFASTFTDCEHSAGNRKATCEIEGLALTGDGDDLHIFVPITVSADVEAPVALKPGTVTAAALGQAPADQPSLKAGTPKLPSIMKLVPAHEVDPSDNSDDFAVIVAAKTGGGGGGAGGDGGLPVTGPQAGLIGGVGAAVLAAGGAMFVLARRRRVVLVTPGDEKPTA